jgi:excisionase family DNA binding protein
MKAEEFVLPDPMEIPIESIAPVITRLSSLQTALAARLIRIPIALNQNESLPESEDELLTTADAAKLLNVSEDWIYRRAGRLPFARRLSRKALRFSKTGLLKWRKARLG